MRRLLVLLVLGGSVSLLTSCKTEEPSVQQTPAFGGPVSTIPWNQPQRWEGGAGGFNALRGNEENN